MDINQLIADLQEISQKNSISHYKRDRCAEAATALATFQAETAQLRAELEQKEKYYEQMIDALAATESTELEQVKRERDAAITDLKKWSICATCKNYCPRNKSTHCRVKRAYLPGGNWAGCSNWQWRGPQKED